MSLFLRNHETLLGAQGKMVLEGPMDEIQDRMNVSSPLNIAVSGNRDTAVQILRSHPYVETIAIRQEEIAVTFGGDRQDEVLLLQQLIDADVPVYAFQRTRGNLESIFMQITDHEEGKVVLSNEDY